VNMERGLLVHGGAVLVLGGLCHVLSFMMDINMRQSRFQLESAG
jgi:hypothetical protein